MTSPIFWPLVFDRSWRAVVRVKITPTPVSLPYDADGANLLYSGEFFGRLFSDDRFRKSMNRAVGVPIDEFHHLGMQPYRGTRFFDLKFVGRNEAEVRRLSELAVTLVTPLALTNSHIADFRLIGVKTVPSVKDRRDRFFLGRSMVSEDW